MSAPCMSNRHALSTQFSAAATCKLAWRGVAGDERAEALEAMVIQAPVRLAGSEIFDSVELESACAKADGQRTKVTSPTSEWRKCGMVESMNEQAFFKPLEKCAWTTDRPKKRTGC